MALPTDILITGLGLVTPLGNSADSFWESLMAGRSGIVWREGYGPDDPVPQGIGAMVRDFDGRLYIKPRKAMKVMCREIQFGHSSAMLAVEQSGLDLTAVPLDRFSVLFGAETFQGELDEVQTAIRSCTDADGFHFSGWGERAMKEVQPLWMLKYLPNMTASHISIALAATGPNNTICQGDLSSGLALVEAATLIERGWVDRAIAGGTGSRVSFNCNAGRGLGGLSHGFAAPESASRPFHSGRNGFVAGEGAASLLLESRTAAAQRGATPLARLAGWYRGFCGPDAEPAAMVDSLVHACQTAVGRAGIPWPEISHINVSAGGMPREDGWEEAAIAELSRRERVQPWIVPGKAWFGNTGAGSSLIELAVSLLALQRGKLPQLPEAVTASRPDLKWPVHPVPVSGSAALKLSISGTGQILAIVVARPD